MFPNIFSNDIDYFYAATEPVQYKPNGGKKTLKNDATHRAGLSGMWKLHTHSATLLIWQKPA